MTHQWDTRDLCLRIDRWHQVWYAAPPSGWNRYRCYSETVKSWITRKWLKIERERQGNVSGTPVGNWSLLINWWHQILSPLLSSGQNRFWSVFEWQNSEMLVNSEIYTVNLACRPTTPATRVAGCTYVDLCGITTRNEDDTPSGSCSRSCSLTHADFSSSMRRENRNVVYRRTSAWAIVPRTPALQWFQRRLLAVFDFHRAPKLWLKLRWHIASLTAWWVCYKLLNE